MDVLIAEINDFKMRRWFLAKLIILYIARIEHKNNADEDYINDVHIFLLSDFLSRFDTFLSGVSTILINNDFWI